MAENIRETEEEKESSPFLAGWFFGRPKCWWFVKRLAPSSWCLLCYKTEYDSNLFVPIATLIGDWADLENRPRLAHAFLSKANKDKRIAAELIDKAY